jgi:hypothetical protein
LCLAGNIEEFGEWKQPLSLFYISTVAGPSKWESSYLKIKTYPFDLEFKALFMTNNSKLEWESIDNRKIKLEPSAALKYLLISFYFNENGVEISEEKVDSSNKFLSLFCHIVYHDHKVKKKTFYFSLKIC